MRERIIKWLGAEILETARTREERLKRQIDHLEEELRRSMKYIGALYEYLGVRPQRTFVEDFSRLPEEQQPTMEVIKAAPIKKKSLLKENPITGK